MHLLVLALIVADVECVAFWGLIHVTGRKDKRRAV